MINRLKRLLKKESLRKKIDIEQIRYFNELSDADTDNLINANIVTCDCNKKSLLYFCDKNENAYRYTSAQYYNETRQKKLKEE